jgi:hypothetical protein
MYDIDVTYNTGKDELLMAIEGTRIRTNNARTNQRHGHRFA